MQNKVVAVMTIRVMGPPFVPEEEAPEDFDKRNQEVVDSLGDAFSKAEDTVNEVLPEGYYCKIESF